MATYKIIGERFVNPVLSMLVKKTVAAAAEKLGIDVPEVKWFLNADRTYPTDSPAWYQLKSAEAAGTETFEFPRELDGLFDRNQPESIFLRVDLSLEKALEVAAHELRHKSQAENNPALFADRHACETDSQDFADYGRRYWLQLWGVYRD